MAKDTKQPDEMFDQLRGVQFPQDAQFVKNKRGEEIPNPYFNPRFSGLKKTYDPWAMVRMVNCYFGAMILNVWRKEKHNGIEVWVETPEEIVVPPMGVLSYHGFVLNTVNSHFVEADESAITDDWIYPVNEEQTINMLKRIPGISFREYADGYTSTFHDERRPVMKFIIDRNKQIEKEEKLTAYGIRR